MLFNTALTLDALGDRAQAIGHAEATLRIFEPIEDSFADDARRRLAQWRRDSNAE